MYCCIQFYKIGQLYSRVCGIGGGRQMTSSDWPCMAVRISSEGTSLETWMTSLQAHMTAAWKIA